MPTAGQARSFTYGRPREHAAPTFSNFHVVPSLNSASACWDIAGWLSPDGCRFYMSSTRSAGQNEQIYVATRGG